jgi:hypothetical protein
MSLVDALRKGIDLVNESERGRIVRAQAKYADPMERNKLYAAETENKYLDRGLAAKIFDAETRNQFLPESLRLANQHQGLMNSYQGITNQYLPDNLRLSNESQRLKNTYQDKENNWYDRDKQSMIDERNALSYARKQGLSGLGVGGKEEIRFNNEVAQDNPHLKTPEQVREAANVYAQGGNQLSDGTPLRPISESAKRSLDRLTKGSSYSGAIVPIIKANQADAELKVLMDMSNKDFAPYATTYAGYSPEQIADTFKKDEASQKRLGNFIASQAAQYEAAQIRNRIAGGEPGISATQELMGKSGQIIKDRYPRLSATARQQATKRLDEYLDAGLKARRQVGIGASDATIKKNNSNKASSGSRLKYNPVSGEFEEM